MKYEDYELLELFENESENLYPDGQLLTYKTNEINGFIFEFKVWNIYEDIYLTLYYKGFEKPIYDFKIHFVTKLK